MTQPKLKSDTLAVLNHHGLSAKLYQPVTLFRPGKRKLPNVPEPDDPWECFLRHHGEFGIAARGRGDTPDEAVADALNTRSNTGLKFAISNLADAFDDLAGAYRRAR